MIIKKILATSLSLSFLATIALSENNYGPYPVTLKGYGGDKEQDTSLVLGFKAWL